MATPQLYSADETISLIQERAKISGDRFKIHVWRRPMSGGNSMQVAGVDAATVDHVADPARWLPSLMGGGEYVLHVFHSTEQPAVRIGGPIPVSYDSKAGSPFGLPRQLPNLKAMRSENWTGPMILTSPPMDLVTEEQPLAGATPKIPTAPVPQAGLPSQVTVSSDPNITYQLAQIAEQRADLARREKEAAEAAARTARELTEQREENKRMASESKLRDELRAAQNETNAAIARLTTQLSVPKPEGAGIDKIIAALAPVVAGFIQSGNESRLQLAKMAEESSRRREEAEDRRLAEAAKAEDRRAQTQLEIAKLTNVKPGMSEEMKMLLDTLKSDKSNNSTAAMSEMMTGMINAMGTVTKMSINMIETVADQMGGDPEDPVVTAIKEGTKAMMMLTQGSQSASRSVVPQKQAAAQPQKQAAPPQQQRAPQPQAQPQQKLPPAGPPAGATATGPQATAPGVPTAGSVSAAPAPAPEAVPEAVPTKTDLLEKAIRGLQPADSVARILVAMIAQKEPSLGVELEKNDGNPNRVLYARLGEKWVEDNLGYLNELGSQFDEQGAAAGLFEADEPAEPIEQPNGVADPALSAAEISAEG